MEAPKDQIDELLAAYAQAAAKRLAEKDRLKKERKLFEANAVQQIKGVFIPVMQHLKDRLDKNLFRFRVHKGGSSSSRETYLQVSAKKEMSTSFSISLRLAHEENKILLEYSHAVEGQEEKVKKLLNPEDIDEALIHAIFIKCLSKLSE